MIIKKKIMKLPFEDTVIELLKKQTRISRKKENLKKSNHRNSGTNFSFSKLLSSERFPKEFAHYSFRKNALKILEETGREFF